VYPFARSFFATLLLMAGVPLQAQTTPVDLSAASIEDLMNIEITSASRKEERADEVPAAVYVITHNDIRRSGMTSVPDLLRLVPGVQVAQVNANKWAVSVRGFNGLYSNKLLVLVDGRSVYNPVFAGVLWDTEDVMLEDVDHIEVIRGPGAAVWGANAVNGVINILTRSAADTKGLLVRARTGTLDPGNVAIRYGGTSGSGAYRAYTQISTHGDFVVGTPAVAAGDHWHSVLSGFRGDWSVGPDSYMIQGNASVTRQRPLWLNFDPAANNQADTSAVADAQVADVVGGWTHTHGNGATLHLQAYVDYAHRLESVVNYRRNTLDFDAFYRSPFAERHDLVIGGGLRHVVENIDGGPGYSFTPDRARETLLTAFAQDEIIVTGRVHVTLGAKLEHESDDGLLFQPTARLMWTFQPHRHVWAAVSRAIRSPSLVDKGLRIDFPPTVQASLPNGPPLAITVLGNPAAQDEGLISTEGGYRLDLGLHAAIDVAAFLGRYKRLQTSEPSLPNLVVVDGRPVLAVTTLFQNLLDADTKGIEISGRVAMSDAWQMDGAFSSFHLTPHLDASSLDSGAAAYDGTAPRYQWSAHSALSIGPRLQTDIMLFYVGALGQSDVPAYTRADARFEWTFTPRVSITAQGQNLLHASHAESGPLTTIITTRLPRSVSLGVAWRF
jgi:iron complex outermembrane recepter protein